MQCACPKKIFLENYKVVKESRTNYTFAGVGEEGPSDGGQSTGRERTAARRRRVVDVLNRRQDDLTLILSHIHDPHNVSAIYRSCDAFGVSKVRLYYKNQPFPELKRKTSASARKWVETERHADADAMLTNLRGEGFKIIATSFEDGAIPLWDLDFLRPSAIILGNEHDGVEEELRKKADELLYVPMMGMIQSLNVSVAAAVILAEAARQRTAAGLYQSSRAKPELYEQRLARWLEK